jgi:hypothetical protein
MKDIKKLKEEILKTKTELSMQGYLDGWHIIWLKEKLKRLNTELQELEN